MHVDSKVIPDKEALRIGLRQRRKCPQFTSDTCPGPPPPRCPRHFSVPRSPSRPPATPGSSSTCSRPRPPLGTPDPAPSAPLPPPRRPSPRRSPGPRLLALARNASRGHSPPPRRPPAGRPLGILPSRLYLSGALPALERRPREGTAQASSAKGPAPQPHLLPGPLSAPPRHGFFLGHESTGSAAWARSAGQGGVLAPAAAATSVRSAPAPPRGQGLGGAPPTARSNGRSAGPRGCLRAVSRLTVRAAGRLGTARGASVPRLDRHVSVPFFSPAFRPFPQNSTFLSSSLSLSSCGGGWKRAVGGRRRGEEGAGRRSGPAPGVRGPAATAPLPRPLRDPGWARGLSPVGLRVPPPRSRGRACTNRAGEKALWRSLCTPSCGAQPRRVIWVYCLGLRQVAASSLRVFKDRESDVEWLKVTEDSAGRYVKIPSLGGSWNSHA
uniref:uncharacterized protein LOC114672645 n=1 Tax=Macaca mulatta TaxID=9544 RepID=UPI0010A226AE|nr:uncharacterized protein LOC114672645 [Macaca mulatta]